MHHPIDRIVFTTAFVTPVVEHWLERFYLAAQVHSGFMLPSSFVALAKQCITGSTNEDLK